MGTYLLDYTNLPIYNCSLIMSFIFAVRIQIRFLYVLERREERQL
jgi:hypothetical protein